MRCAKKGHRKINQAFSLNQGAFVSMCAVVVVVFGFYFFLCLAMTLLATIQEPDKQTKKLANEIACIDLTVTSA